MSAIIHTIECPCGDEWTKMHPQQVDFARTEWTCNCGQVLVELLESEKDEMVRTLTCQCGSKLEIERAASRSQPSNSIVKDWYCWTCKGRYRELQCPQEEKK